MGRAEHLTLTISTKTNSKGEVQEISANYRGGRPSPNESPVYDLEGISRFQRLREAWMGVTLEDWDDESIALAILDIFTDHNDAEVVAPVPLLIPGMGFTFLLRTKSSS